MKPCEFKVRPATDADVASMRQFEKQIFGDDAYDVDTLRELLIESRSPNPQTAVCVATSTNREVRGVAVGQIWQSTDWCERYGLSAPALAQQIGEAGRIGYGKSLAVDAQLRLLGLGRLLTLHRDGFFRAGGIEHVLLWQMPRPGLARFLERLGYRRLPLAGKIRYADGSPASLWHRALNP